ncbi:MAG TPA: cytochrome P450 [Baekduia sp.]|nr:cytochrome P450 [Baekduia sp.]
MPTAEAAARLADFSTFADGPPHERFAALRALGPVHWTDPTDQDTGFWSVVAFDELAEVSKDWERFSSARRGIFVRDGGILPREFQELVFSNMDPPGHRRQRAILQKVFTSQAVGERAADIRAVARELVGAVAGKGACDVVADLAVPFPLTVTSNMLGVPAQDRDKLFHWTNQMADLSLGTEAKNAMIGELGAYVLGLVAERRARPQDDLLSRLIAAEVDGERLTDVELVAHFAQLMAGGNETTRNAFAGGMLALMEHPAQRAQLLADPSLTPGAVEEILRWHTPILHNARTATRDTEIAGVRIREGDLVVLWHVAANRDPRANDRPDEFDVSRPRVRHCAFGGPGDIHFCLGNQLARLELRIFLDEVLRCLPDMELAGPVTRQPSSAFHWMTSVPVTFTPVAAAAS